MSDKITINEIAKLANTSKTTVSFYLNGKTDKMSEETQARIAKVIEETNYSPSIVARSLNSKGTKLIGVIIGDITNTFANQIVKGIDDYAHGKGYQLIVGNSNYIFEREKSYVERMLAMGVDGFVVQPSSKFKSLLKTIKKEGKDVVFIDSQSTLDHAKWVKTNNYESVLNVTETLIKQNYDEYILISADPSVLSTRKERATAFVDTLKTHNLECITNIVDADIESEEITKILESQLQFGKRTLIFVANCFLLPRVYTAMHNYRRLMPEFIGLVGFDNTEWTSFSSPTVSTIEQPAYEEGYIAARILIDSTEGTNKELPNQILQCTYHWKESTGNIE